MDVNEYQKVVSKNTIRNQKKRQKAREKKNSQFNNCHEEDVATATVTVDRKVTIKDVETICEKSMKNVEAMINDRYERQIDELVMMNSKLESTIVELRSELKSMKHEVDEKLNNFYDRKLTERVKAFQKTASAIEKEGTTINKSREAIMIGSDSIDGRFPQKVQDALDALNNTIGQKHLKEYFERLCFKAMKQQKLSKFDRKNFVDASYHMVFAGKPGTGKTLIAGLVAKLLCALGIVKTNRFKVVGLHELKAKYLGQTPHELAKTFEHPGVYFIDEAYQIKDHPMDSYGAEVLSGLCELLENRRHEIIVIMAGYQDKMADLFAHNAGLESRFHWIFDFKDYDCEELLQIADYSAEKMDHKFTVDARNELRKDMRDGLNGREIRNFVEEIEFYQSGRLGNASEFTYETLTLLTVDDVIKARTERNNIKNMKDIRKRGKKNETGQSGCKCETMTKFFQQLSGPSVGFGGSGWDGVE